MPPARSAPRSWRRSATTLLSECRIQAIATYFQCPGNQQASACVHEQCGAQPTMPAPDLTDGPRSQRARRASSARLRRRRALDGRLFLRGDLRRQHARGATSATATAQDAAALRRAKARAARRDAGGDGLGFDEVTLDDRLAREARPRRFRCGRRRSRGRHDEGLARDGVPGGGRLHRRSRRRRAPRPRGDRARVSAGTASRPELVPSRRRRVSMAEPRREHRTWATSLRSRRTARRSRTPRTRTRRRPPPREGAPEGAAAGEEGQVRRRAGGRKGKP